jgi:Lon protease-like protein
LAELPGIIPLFPLPNAVLFPKMALPLHVFEPRYRKMVVDAWQAHRTIGMMLLKPGWEADYQGRPPLYSHGCAGLIEQCEALEDGRFNIVLRGVSRFRVLEELAGEPYRLAKVEPLADAAGADAASLDAARRRVLAAIGKASDGPALLVIQPELPHEIFVNALAQSMDLTPVERQSLLDCDSVVGRYERLLEVLGFKALESAHGRGGGDRVH